MPELLGTAEVAKALGVSEADVIATLEKGDLKGKKIGVSAPGSSTPMPGPRGS